MDSLITFFDKTTEKIGEHERYYNALPDNEQLPFKKLAVLGHNTPKEPNITLCLDL